MADVADADAGKPDETAAGDSAGTELATAEGFDAPSNTVNESPDSATARPEADRVTPERSIGPDRPNETGGPSFDVIRVAGDGGMILAGKAEPLATVVIMDGDTVLGEEIADLRGDWIFMPIDPLSAGNHQIGAMERQPNGSLVPSSDLVLVVVPLRGTDIAGRETDRADQPLVMLVPRDGGPATVIVQAPAPDAPAEGSLEGTAVAAAEEQPEAQEGGSVLFSRPAMPGSDTGDTATTRTGETADAAGETPDAATPDADAVGDVALAEPGDATDPFAAEGNTGGDQDAAATEEDQGPVAFSRPTIGDAPTDTAADSDVSVGVIDYDQGGDVTLSGDAQPGATVQVYLDNAVLGVTEASPSGSWQLTPQQAVPPGPHEIRVDQIAPSGDVIARIALPFVRAEPVNEMPQDVFVVVEPGNSLWRIARRVYGEGIRYTEILAANRAQIADPNLIYPGQVFMIPRG
ncbi:MAG: LysM peptidoglycan-binding domain-containing protein [Alphaproteobacteria bacterium]